jgi:exodeoxyribonuclease VII small subunit
VQEPDLMSYEQARAELEVVVSRLEDGATTLEEALALWERGQALHRRCAELLGVAEERLRALRPEGGGE